MGVKTVLALSALLVVVVGSPFPDESAYKIPRVGTGRRSQYYVRHSDGTYKYGHDTGEGAFEDARSSVVGEQSGAFGYVNPEGQTVNLQYKAGESGFVPKGSHLPATHPDFDTAHALARNRRPFHDPLANPNNDPSYGFTFQGDEHARSELTDASGRVRGSYSYIDENGQTRSYTYTAGSGIGFVIEGDGLPQDPLNPSPTPAATKLSSGRLNFPAVVNQHLSRSGPIRVQTYTASPSVPSPRRPVEQSNVKTSLALDGRQSFDFKTSTHSRGETADANNNVVGSFAFTADDDGQRRAVQYKAGAGTGFVVEGDHLPRGPAVPGAPLGVPSGNIVPVRETPFVDPLANSNADASYTFSYQEAGQSRSEVSDEDGTVRGSYTYTDDEGRVRTLTYTAGKGIGFVVEGDGVPEAETTSSGVLSYSSPSVYSTSSVISPSASSASSVSSASSISSPSSSSPGSRFKYSSGRDYQVHQYDANENPDKVGYVLTFNN
ncbi:uncharacterized protein LOC122268144 [Penaeus japonicus]|uniref:uncharacterized protein LOC122268144 n=1 Tax=Penaeus japonicus TaxID=27405 RepID=UPI001C70D6BB|nr:uncharacterized protein LOC122268144 [Penaeus japonicus]